MSSRHGRCRRGFARAGSLTQLSRAARFPRSTGLPATTERQGAAPARRPRQTHHERGYRMTRPSQRASSERHAPHRSEPATALTAIRPTRQTALSIPTLRPHCPMFHKKGISEYREGTRAAIASLVRYEHQGQGGDTPSSEPIGIAFPNGRSDGRKGPGVAISPVAAPGTTAIFNTTPFRTRGRGQDAASDRTR
jgi:hypothetical protein